MITLFDVLRIIVPLLLAMFGGVFGLQFGGRIVCGIGAVIGFVAGIYLGRLPLLFTIRSMRRELSRRPTEELLAELREHRTFMPNFLLLELASRGQDISAELPVILDLLASEHFHYRTRGWAAMLSAFPTVARQMRGYSPAHSVDDCRSEVERVRHSLST